MPRETLPREVLESYRLSVAKIQEMTKAFLGRNMDRLRQVEQPADLLCLRYHFPGTEQKCHVLPDIAVSLEGQEKQENIKRKGKENDKGRAVGHVESGD